ncbi:uncharacterized protein B0I36DRAFT_120884 [Microdochium trichocladiopsis]|uniref:Uncharacterized protein n=1 Tax=Microdochium trichocladiopsis TaxID=1682393 RepID=A0A9P8Y9Q5_9PEZI|nr:uncharacterized protein B0I36DRAFT_120884 [Microdochium trichocladiopsis]KAH7031275.1 hypothetical protein B0I36DRAFT_120884 [Microdochium trichocladiopsis]
MLLSDGLSHGRRCHDSFIISSSNCNSSRPGDRGDCATKRRRSREPQSWGRPASSLGRELSLCCICCWDILSGTPRGPRWRGWPTYWRHMLSFSVAGAPGWVQAQGQEDSQNGGGSRLTKEGATRCLLRSLC